MLFQKIIVPPSSGWCSPRRLLHPEHENIKTAQWPSITQQKTCIFWYYVKINQVGERKKKHEMAKSSRVTMSQTIGGKPGSRKHQHKIQKHYDLWNVKSYTPNDTAPHSTRLAPSTIHLSPLTLTRMFITIDDGRSLIWNGWWNGRSASLPLLWRSSPSDSLDASPRASFLESCLQKSEWKRT